MAGLKQALKKINSLPVRFSMKHYYAFGETVKTLKDNKLDSGQSWDVLRQTHPDFSISENREEWLKASESEIHKDGQDRSLKKRAQDVVDVINRLGVHSLFSVGIGGGGLEYQIKKIKPELKIIGSEYSQVTVDQLKKVFLECDEIIQFDITTKQWPMSVIKPDGKQGLSMIYRIDASFTDKEWREIFQNMYNSGVENILYIPTTFLTILSIFIRLKRRLSWVVKRQKFAFSGHLRTKKSFQGFWENLYDEEMIDFGGVKGFLLKRK
jgi:hypothetical protein